VHNAGKSQLQKDTRDIAWLGAIFAALFQPAPEHLLMESLPVHRKFVGNFIEKMTIRNSKTVKLDYQMGSSNYRGFRTLGTR
jgi:hypothetical protein